MMNILCIDYRPANNAGEENIGLLVTETINVQQNGNDNQDAQMMQNE